MGNTLTGHTLNSPAPWEDTIIVEFQRPGKAKRYLQILVSSTWTIVQLRATIARLLNCGPDSVILSWKGARAPYKMHANSLMDLGITKGDVIVAELAEWEGRIHIADSENMNSRFSVAVASHYTLAQLLFAIHCKTGVPAGAICLMKFVRPESESAAGRWEFVTPTPEPPPVSAFHHLSLGSFRSEDAAAAAAPEFKLTLAELGIGKDSTLRMAIDADVLGGMSLDARERLAAAMRSDADEERGVETLLPVSEESKPAGAASLTTVTSELLDEWRREHVPAPSSSPLSESGGERKRSGLSRGDSTSSAGGKQLPVPPAAAAETSAVATASVTASSDSSDSSQRRSRHARPHPVRLVMSPGEARALSRSAAVTAPPADSASPQSTSHDVVPSVVAP